jgi:hypothetical protein
MGVLLASETLWRCAGRGRLDHNLLLEVVLPLRLLAVLQRHGVASQTAQAFTNVLRRPRGATSAEFAFDHLIDFGRDWCVGRIFDRDPLLGKVIGDRRQPHAELPGRL